MMFYLLNTILFSAVFWLVYRLLLKTQTFFTANRIYLLDAPVLALILPLLSFEFFRFGTLENPVFQLPIAGIGNLNQTAGSAAFEETATTVATYLSILFLIYALGVLISLVLFVLKHRKLQNLKRKGKVMSKNNFRLVKVPNSKIAFTFLNTVFVGANYSENEKNQILNHEKVHLQQKHSWDLIYFEVLRIVFWFNPFVYLFQKNIAEVHEFIADQNATKSASKKAYIQSLLNANFGTEHLSFTNSFFTENSLKTRIVMLHKKSSSRFSKLRFLVIAPLAFLMLTYVSCADDQLPNTQNSDQLLQEESIPSSSQEKQVEEIPFRVIDKVPEFPDSPKFQNKEAAKEEFAKKIRAFVNQNFDTQKMKSFVGSGVHRIYVQFKIGTQGQVYDIRSHSEDSRLEEEAKRVIGMLPRMIPGEQYGKPIVVLYTLPISFQVD